MTKQRVEALSDVQAKATSDAPSPAPVQSLPKQPATAASPTNQANVQAQIAPKPSPQVAQKPTEAAPASSEPNTLLLILFILGAIIGIIAVFNRIQRKERLVAEQRRLAAERQGLIDKYGIVDAERIIAQQVWQGMTQEQLIASWGNPADRDIEIRRAKTKETWKYNQIGRNRYASRVCLEDGEVVGWKQ